MPLEKYDSVIHTNVLTLTNQDSTISYTEKNSKMFNLISKDFRTFYNTQTESRI